MMLEFNDELVFILDKVASDLVIDLLLLSGLSEMALKHPL